MLHLSATARSVPGSGIRRIFELAAALDDVIQLSVGEPEMRVASHILAALLDFAARHDLWVISDEVYEYFTFTGPFTSVASLDSADQVFSVYSLSKTCGLTGGRVGYLVTPPVVSATFRAAQEATVSCVNTPAQLAAVAAIEGARTAPSTCGSTSRTVQEEMSPSGQRHSCSPSGWPSPRVPPLDPQAKAGSGAVLPDSTNGS